MKRRFLALGLLLLLPLQSCSTVLLNREYVTEQIHEESGFLTDTSILRADSYDSLVSAILQLVNQRAEHGIIRLYNYSEDVGADLANACLEVKRNNPLGAYAVDYITHDFSRIVSYYEVNLYITYRRTYEQIKGIVSATGSNAIKEVLQDKLKDFSPSAVLRIGYFEEDEAYIRTLLEEAYDATPSAAFGLPECHIELYPEKGTDRIIEVTLTYQNDQEVLLRQKEQVERIALSLTQKVKGNTTEEVLAELYQILKQHVTYQVEGSATIYAALVEQKANSEGVAIAMSLLCQAADIPCKVIRGTLHGVPWVWNQVTLNGKTVEMDVVSAFLNEADVPTYMSAGNMGEAYQYRTAVD